MPPGSKAKVACTDPALVAKLVAIVFALRQRRSINMLSIKLFMSKLNIITLELLEEALTILGIATGTEATGSW